MPPRALAEDVLMDNRLVRMSPDGFAEFMEILSAPAAPVPHMVEMAKRPAPWEAGYPTKR
ncbi:type II toxin-antitoxin system TacA family antitoxin [Mesorhizobium atlanticum]